MPVHRRRPLLFRLRPVAALALRSATDAPSGPHAPGQTMPRSLRLLGNRRLFRFPTVAPSPRSAPALPSATNVPFVASQGPREDNAAYPAKAGLSPPLPLPRKDESAIPTSCVAHTLPPPLPTPLLHDPHLQHPNRRQLATIDVFVDDFIGAAQGPPARLNRVRRILLTAVDQVFRPVDPDDSIYRNEPSSVKKMLQGDANWGTCKTILGWIIDTVAMTISLPPRRLQRLADILTEIPLSQKDNVGETLAPNPR